MAESGWGMDRDEYLALPVEEISEHLMIDSGHVFESADLLEELCFMKIRNKEELIGLQLMNTKAMDIKDDFAIQIDINVDINSLDLSEDGKEVIGGCIYDIKRHASEFIKNQIKECIGEFCVSKGTRPNHDEIWENYEKKFLMDNVR